MIQALFGASSCSLPLPPRITQLTNDEEIETVETHWLSNQLQEASIFGFYFITSASFVNGFLYPQIHHPNFVFGSLSLVGDHFKELRTG